MRLFDYPASEGPYVAYVIRNTLVKDRHGQFRSYVIVTRKSIDKVFLYINAQAHKPPRERHSASALYDDWLKQGGFGFDHIVAEAGIWEEDADNACRLYIEVYNSRTSSNGKDGGYNLTSGGKEGYKHHGTSISRRSLSVAKSPRDHEILYPERTSSFVEVTDPACHSVELFDSPIINPEGWKPYIPFAKPNIPVEKYTIDGELICRYESISDAAKDFRSTEDDKGNHHSAEENIRKASLQFECRTGYGYRWKRV